MLACGEGDIVAAPRSSRVTGRRLLGARHPNSVRNIVPFQRQNKAPTISGGFILAERERFELSEALRPHRISSAAH